MRAKLQCGALLFALSSGSVMALGTDAYEIPYIGFSGLYEFPDSARDADNGYGFRGLFGFPFNDRNSVEVSSYFLERERKIDGNKDYQAGIWVDLIHDFGLFGFDQAFLPNFKPYVLAGPGVEHDDERGDAHFNPAFDVGAGLLFPLKIGGWDWGWSLRTEGRVVAEYNNHDFPDAKVPVDYHIEIGINIPLTPFFADEHPVAAEPDCPTQVVDPDSAGGDCN